MNDLSDFAAEMAQEGQRLFSQATCMPPFGQERRLLMDQALSYQRFSHELYGLADHRKD